ncbi:pentatricopeptide repeat-containing protein At3g14730 [Magnolia sinica]|uniref:pentatricopeptide repeat-containing protein At3g14730 n=1 Tax=Magnolia sinica TaxID=86752 RepID=UPI002658DB18|nr:pentatricopeptide repeat-containing protein At3g14730 [Magnolia sinica]XP_058110779.1 pentatricopeptide repeat-containing protein At3g14730 [Magnolia sinica]XP_058110780.1 pentatricopeptide repeat-containing protein At3g14730 [Magnolia sinica]XP_058110781.1 pentatricopeptide repeat-containing protein At3g14730 [Magnolia sinica]
MKRKTLSSYKLLKNKTFHLAANLSSSIESFQSKIHQKSDVSSVLSDLSGCISSLQACALHKNLSKGKEIHSWMIINGFVESPFSITSLINMYSKCDRPGHALEIFDRACYPNLFAWNAIIAGFVTNGLPEDAIEFYLRMRRENVAPDKFTFPCVIKACSDVADLWEGKKIHAGLFKAGSESDVFIASALINFYLKFNRMEDARQVFDRLLERDVVSWNAMINGYAQIGEFERALEVLAQMLEEAIAPSKFTVTGVLSVFTALEDLRSGQKIHGFVEKIGYGSDIIVLNSLIDMYGKCKCIKDAQEIFERMHQRDLFSWNSILSVYEQSGDHDGTLRLFDRMRDAGIQPDSITISTILPVCSQLAALMHGREIHGYMIVSGMRRDGDVYVENAIIDMYAKCGSLRDARVVFDRMMDRDVVSWNIMILGYGLHGHGHEALDVFSSMLAKNVEPDEVTFVGVLTACSHAGLVGRGLEILVSMEPDHGVIPTVEHYACAVDMLGRAGRLSESYELARTMPIEPNPIVWRALLAACRLHGDASLAEIAASQIFELEPGHCGSYVLLANVYGDTGRYKDVSEVRQTMKLRNVRKMPGCSWIEVNTGVHVFVTGDRAHQQSDQIYTQLHMLIGQLREYGYSPEVRHVSPSIH